MRWILPALLLWSAPLSADPADIRAVDLTRGGEAWRVSVTIEHDDTGWDDYADGWRVELQNGDILGTRVLHHPHVDEQPFTRSLSGVAIPAGTAEIYVRARTSVEGWGAQSFGPVPLP